jgi:hypothetical protein
MKTALSGFRSLIVATSAIVLISGCAPRGESHTVDQILNDARTSYTEMKVDVSPDVNTSLKTLTGSLDKLAGLGGGGDARQVSASIADSLTTLMPKAGLTQRSAMAELINQYRSISTSTGTPTSVGAPNLKLVVARTYSLMSAELTSTKFRL